MKKNSRLSDEKQQLQDVSDRYDRVVRVLGENVVEDAVQQDIQEQKSIRRKTTNGANANREVFTKDLAWGAQKERDGKSTA